MSSGAPDGVNGCGGATVIGDDAMLVGVGVLGAAVVVDVVGDIAPFHLWKNVRTSARCDDMYKTSYEPMA